MHTSWSGLANRPINNNESQLQHNPNDLNTNMILMITNTKMDTNINMRPQIITNPYLAKTQANWVDPYKVNPHSMQVATYTNSFVFLLADLSIN